MCGWAIRPEKSRLGFSSNRTAHDQHVHDHVNVDVDVHVLVDVIGFSSRPGGEASFAKPKAEAS
jgi:hypothetical protein